MKKLLFPFLMLFLSFLYADVKVDIPDIGYLYLGTELELQNGTYKEIKDKIAENVYKITKNKNKVIIQQAGLNNFDADASKLYCRIIINTNFGTQHDFPSLNEKILLNPKELSLLNDMYKEETLSALAESKMPEFEQKLLQWDTIKIGNVNNIDSLHISYVRQLNKNPPVIVNKYIFYNNDRMHIVTISYRKSEADKWETICNKVLKSIVFLKV